MSPLVELGFTKADVRAGAARVGLAIWDKPAAACLSSRIPYGTSVTRERLAQIGGFEAELKALGFRQVRVRYHEQAGAHRARRWTSSARAANPACARGDRRGRQEAWVALRDAGSRRLPHRQPQRGHQRQIAYAKLDPSRTLVGALGEPCLAASNPVKPQSGGGEQGPGPRG